jgi:hypothetical protein
MGPGNTRFWLPPVRLSAFFAAVVVVGNLVIHAVRPPVPSTTEPGGTSDYYSRKKRKLERHLRTIERFIGDGFFTPPSKSAPVPAEEPGSSTVPAGAGAPIASLPDPAPAAECSAGGGVASAGPAVPALAPGATVVVEPEVLAWTEPDLPLFSWPSPLKAAALREIDLPRAESGFHAPLLTPEFVRACYRQAERDLFLEAGDAVLHAPEILVDGLLSLAGDLFPRQGSYDWTVGEDAGIASRILDFHVEERQGHIFSDFLARWLEREQRYFSRFEDSHLFSIGFEDGTEEVDMSDLLDDQRKILWDVLRKTYLSKYKLKAEERIRDDAFYFNEWRGMDFVVLPPLMAGYVYYRGLDKKFSVGGTWLRAAFEPARKWGQQEDLVAGFSLEWGLKGWPIGLIVSAGLYDGNLEVDFVGIGTSVGMARKALHGQLGD